MDDVNDSSLLRNINKTINILFAKKKSRNENRETAVSIIIEVASQDLAKCFHVNTFPWV